MDHLGDNFFTGSGFAFKKNGEVCLCNLAYALEGLDPRGRSSDQLFAGCRRWRHSETAVAKSLSL